MESEGKSDTGNNMGNWYISKSLRQYLSNRPGKQKINELQKTLHTHTTESANVKVQNIFHGRKNITGSTNC